MSRDERARASLEASPSSSATMARSGTDDLIAGVVAGAACTLAGHPFDTVKVFLQDHAAKGARAHTTASATREIYSRRGVRGLYAGVAAPLIGASLETGANYACFHLIREGVALDAAGGRDGFASRLGASAVSGAIAGAAMCAFLTPFELVKCRAQVGQGGGRAVAVAREIIAQRGVGGLFRGFTHTMMREVPAGAVYFASYEALQTMFPRARRSEDVTRAAFEEQNASGARFRARFVSSRLFSRRLFSRRLFSRRLVASDARRSHTHHARFHPPRRFVSRSARRGVVRRRRRRRHLARRPPSRQRQNHLPMRTSRRSSRPSTPRPHPPSHHRARFSRSLPRRVSGHRARVPRQRRPVARVGIFVARALVAPRRLVRRRRVDERMDARARIDTPRGGARSSIRVGKP